MGKSDHACDSGLVWVDKWQSKKSAPKAEREAMHCYNSLRCVIENEEYNVDSLMTGNTRWLLLLFIWFIILYKNNISESKQKKLKERCLLQERESNEGVVWVVSADNVGISSVVRGVVSGNHGWMPSQSLLRLLFCYSIVL